jgi:hypothetical protein
MELSNIHPPPEEFMFGLVQIITARRSQVCG